MPQTRTYNRSFSGGEISPIMQGRVDDPKYQTGAALVRNFIVLPQGAVENRSGTEFVYETKIQPGGAGTSVVRLIPFTFSISQTMVLEIGFGYMRFFTNGARLVMPSAPAAYSAATTYTRGDMVESGGDYWYCNTATTVGVAPPNAIWYQMPADLTYEIPTPFLFGNQQQSMDMNYVQSNDVMTFVSQTVAPQELRRLGPYKWTLTPIVFGSSLPAPNTPTGVGTTGEAFTITLFPAGTAGFDTSTKTTFALGESLYISGCTGSPFALADGFYVCDDVRTTSPWTHQIKSYDTGIIVTVAAGYTANTGKVQSSTRIPDISNSYVVTAKATTESPASGSVSVVNNLYVNGAYNTINWTAVAGATRYNVYKRQSGLYGYIGSTDGISFIDDNIAPDLGITPPILDPLYATANNYPGAVSYFEQRRLFAGTINQPQQLTFTVSGSESDMSYSIPSKDTDRVSITVAAREANTIRHIVPLNQLILLTSAAEWRVTPINSDAITPSTISVRPQSYVGANTVHPQIVNNSIIYAANRGGHVRELGYSFQSNGYVTGDLSIRSTHLFNDFELTDMTYCKSPYPILWFISSSGKLLGLTYVPEEQIGSWHQHDTDGTFFSLCSVAEGEEDSLYVIVNRNIDGVSKNYIERFATRTVTNPVFGKFADSCLTYNGINDTATEAKLTTGTTYAAGQVLDITAQLGTPFVFPGTTDVGDVFVMIDSQGTRYRCAIVSTTSTSTATAIADKDIPPAFQNFFTANWEFARKDFAGLGHLEDKTVSILADGAVVPPQKVISGAISIVEAASVVTVGIGYMSELQTLPMVLNMEGFGQGKTKNVNTVWLKIVQSSGIFVGSRLNRLTEARLRTNEPYGSPPTLKTAEVEVVILPNWQNGGQIFVQQPYPLPLTVIGMTLEVEIGS